MHDVISTPVLVEEGEVVCIIEEYHASVQEFIGLIAIFSYCKKDTYGKWEAVEDYINSYTIAELSHGCVIYF